MGRKKLSKVIQYIVTNYGLKGNRGDLQVNRLIKVIELLNRKYGIVEYNKKDILEIIDKEENLEIRQRETVYGNNYQYIKVRKGYEGEGLFSRVRMILDKEMEKTREMDYSEFCVYIHGELNQKNVD